MAYHGTGSGSDAAADFDRGHEQVAGTDVHVRSDGGVVLVHAIIVGGDGTAADIGVLTQVGVANIAQMRHLGAVADVRLLHFHKGAGLGLLAKIVARTQVRPRTDVGRATDVGFLHAGTLHMGVGIDDRALRIQCSQIRLL